MAQKFSKVLLSGSTDGLGITVAATGDPGTTIHTAHATSLDEIWIWASNTDTVTRTLTLEWGDSVSDIVIDIAAAGIGLIPVAPGLILTNSKVLKAFGSSANKFILYGFVNRIT